jgi:hypothetical protein
VGDLLPKLRRAFVSLILPTLAVLALIAPATAAAATETVDPGGVRSYWTAERMKEAEPAPVPELPAAVPMRKQELAPSGPPSMVQPVEADGAKGDVAELEGSRVATEPADGEDIRRAYTRTEVSEPTAESVRMHGKVFFSVEDGSSPGDYVCSGTALNSNNGSVVWTAGHCVYDADFGGGYSTNFLFVPAYSAGSAPFGEWPAEELISPGPWRSDGDSSYDYSAVRVAENVAGETLTEVVGGRGIGFNQDRNQNYSSYGYPAKQPPLEFTGGREFVCNSPLGGTDNPPGSGPNTSWIGCDMTGGSSGGGWIADGTLLSVNSYSYCDITGTLCEERLYGPYLDGDAKQLYQQIAGDAEFCQDKKVTILGTGGADKLVGTGGKDVIKAGGGKDKVDAKGGKDIVCGGGGEDTIKGGGGNDKLNGDGGNDVLKGGDGKDTCNGGKGKDKAKGCETEKKIP